MTDRNSQILNQDLSKPTTSLITRPTDTMMNINLSYEDMTRPVEGPQNVMGQLGGMAGGAGIGRSYNTVTGHVEQQAMSNVDFKNQQMSYNVLKYARDPSIIGGGGSNNFVGDANAIASHGGQSLQEYRPAKAEIKSIKRKRKGKGTLGVFNDDEEEKEKGEEASSEEDNDAKKPYMGPWAGWQDTATKTLVPEEEEYEIIQRRRGAMPVDKSKKEVGFGEEKSVFHGKSMHDYQGRTYMHIPRDVETNLTGESGNQECYIPKSCIHTWSGHTKGVTAIRLFPQSGHLLLSSSMDTRVKLWDVYHEGKCLRTFMGHGQAVRDITFNNDGSQFLSAGYDRYTKLWDTETGQCIQAFTNGKIPYCVKFNPDPDKQHIFLSGMSDKKIIQYDTRSGEITQEYDQHLGPVK
jgi:pre-mRNA-processing factor 17